MLREAFTQAMKDAMKSGEKEKLSTIRLIQAALKDKDIEARGLGKEATSEDDILSLLQKMIKQRQDSVTLYTQGNRPELAASEQAEIAVIMSFMPKQMSDDEMQNAIKNEVAALGAAGMKDMGRVIASLKAKYSGQMDFGKASGLVKAALS